MPGLCLILHFILLTLVTAELSVKAKPCIPRYFGRDSFVCVCNATYCDEVEPSDALPHGQYAAYVSSQKEHRLTKFVFKFENDIADNEATVVLDRTVSYQTILGFGGAFTDAAGINIKSLSDHAAENLLKAYFGQNGIEYTLGRIPMASCDFSTRVYSYDDVPGDFNLKHFALVEEDFKYKISYIHAAQQLSRRPITLFASPWSSPAWMKNSGRMAGNGTLIGRPGGKYYKAWAQYFVRFLQEYERHNVTVWGITAQNEPTTGFFPNYSFQTLGFTAETQRDFLARDLGPALEDAGYGKVKVMVLDDSRVNLPSWPKTIMSSPEASKYVSGIAVHWYADFIDPAFPLSLTHDAMPDKFILYTEACAGYIHIKGVPPVLLGEWDRFQTYANNIMDDLANWVVGWTDWNIALDLEGGPNWVQNFVDSPIIVNTTADEFYKQPMFYALGHFSKFLPKGCVRIGAKSNSPEDSESLKILAFSCPDKSTVIQINNRYNTEKTFRIKDPLRGVAKGTMPANSHATLVWW